MLKPSDTFMGYPDLSQLAMRGGHHYVESMNAITLTTVSVKAVTDNITSDSLWQAIGKRSQDLINCIQETELSLLLLCFSSIDWYDTNLYAALVGRAFCVLPHCGLKECDNILKAMKNPKFLHTELQNGVIYQCLSILENTENTQELTHVEDLTDVFRLVQQRNGRGQV